jgi:rSAM/selenodomain-associated transferase 1
VSGGEGPRGAVAIFAKAPVPGRVKTRLVPPLTPEEAASVARACLEDTLRVFVPAGGDTEVRLFLDGRPDAALAAFASSLGVPVVPQAAGDLGTRLIAAFRALRARGANRVLALGSDSPTVEPGRLREAFRALDSFDVVLGPADDGGYWLIGTRNEGADGVFQDIPWSTSGVIRATLARASALGLSLHQLPPWYDIDDAASLMRAMNEGLERAPSLARAVTGLRGRLAAAGKAGA